MTAFYNEIDPYAVQWLKNLAWRDLIVPGFIDGRCVKEIGDLGKFTQAHFFAGLGAWSYALRLAGWPDDMPVWTGSCPCQPFSAAGRKKGTSDARHLWPDWFKLIDECRPPVVFGEQVASPDGLKWFDAVRADLEGAGYAVGAADLCAAGVGAPHIRQRLYFVAVADTRRSGLEVERLKQARAERATSERGRASGELADAEIGGRAKGDENRSRGGEGKTSNVDGARFTDPSQTRELGDASGPGGGRDAEPVPCGQGTGSLQGSEAWRLADELVPPGSTRGAWAGAEWIPCRDGRWRPVEPGSFPLAHGVTARVGRLRAYGNAIVPQVAATFIGAVMEAL